MSVIAHPAYHEAFWVVVGSAAPVIAISYFVVFDRFYKYYARAGKSIGLQVFSTILIFAGFINALILQVSLDALRTNRDSTAGRSTYFMSWVMFADLAFVVLFAVVQAIQQGMQSVDNRRPKPYKR